MCFSLLITGISPAHAGQPVILLDTDTTAAKGPLLRDGTWALAGIFYAYCLLEKARELWNHLGDGRETMKIKTLIADKQVHAITAHDSVKHLVERLNTFHVGALVVSPDGKLIEGIVSERDIVRSLPGKFDMIEDLHVRDIMTVDVFTCTPDSTVSEIMALMSGKRIRHIPVVDAEGGLISIISIGDVVKHYLNELAAENQALKEYVGTV